MLPEAYNPERAATQLQGKALENQLMILIVEDDQLIQGVIEEALSDGGFETTIASSGEEAIDLLDGADPGFRALVTDINLGNGARDGWAVARHAGKPGPIYRSFT